MNLEQIQKVMNEKINEFCKYKIKIKYYKNVKKKKTNYAIYCYILLHIEGITKSRIIFIWMKIKKILIIIQKSSQTLNKK